MKSPNSFAKTIKEEIISKKYKDERLLSMLSSFTRLNGTLEIKHKQESIILKIENPKIAKFIYSSFLTLFNEKPKIDYLKKNNLNKNTCYIINISDAELINKMNIHLIDNEIDKYYFANSERIGGYLAGAFLAAGSVNSPETSNYHLEINCNDLEYAKNFVKLIKKNDATVFDAKIVQRRNKYIVYIKRSDQITDFLVLIGAENGALYFVDATADRDLTNNANRLKNLDTANYLKTTEVAKNDIKIIQKLIKLNGLTNLGSDKAIMLATLRIKYPEDTLEDLAEKMSKELGNHVSKSNINHLLRYFRAEGKNL